MRNALAYRDLASKVTKQVEPNFVQLNSKITSAEAENRDLKTRDKCYKTFLVCNVHNKLECLSQASLFNLV
jgi:hypothetical protein